MKKIFLILITGLLWCNVGNAGLNEPGTDQKCFDLFEKKKVFKKEFLPVVNKDQHIFIVYTSCKGTLWGPVIGATIFHIFKEGFWTFFLGWQYVALGVLIVVIVIYFPEGIMGWLREKYPEKFGEVVDEADRKAQVELK